MWSTPSAAAVAVHQGKSSSAILTLLIIGPCAILPGRAISLLVDSKFVMSWRNLLVPGAVNYLGITVSWQSGFLFLRAFAGDRWLDYVLRTTADIADVENGVNNACR